MLDPFLDAAMVREIQQAMGVDVGCSWSEGRVANACSFDNSGELDEEVEEAYD